MSARGRAWPFGAVDEATAAWQRATRRATRRAVGQTGTTQAALQSKTGVLPKLAGFATGWWRPHRRVPFRKRSVSAVAYASALSGLSGWQTIAS